LVETLNQLLPLWAIAAIIASALLIVVIVMVVAIKRYKGRTGKLQQFINISQMYSKSAQELKARKRFCFNVLLAWL